MDNIKIGSFLQALRKAKGLTQADLADYFGVSNKTVSKWECGESIPEIPVLKGLAEYYDITVDEILNGKRNANEECIEVTRQKNEDYFIYKADRKMTLWMIIAFLVMALGYVLLIIIARSISRCDIPFYISLGIYFVSIALYIIGIYLNPKLDNNFSQEKIKIHNKKKIVFHSAYWSFLIACIVLSYLSYQIPVSETGGVLNYVLSLNQFLINTVIGFSISGLVTLLIYMLSIKLHILQRFWEIIKKYPFDFIVIPLLVVVFVRIFFFPYYELERSDHKIYIYSFFSVGLHFWYMYVIYVLLLASVGTLIFFAVKKRNFMLIPELVFVLSAFGAYLLIEETVGRLLFNYGFRSFNKLYDSFTAVACRLGQLAFIAILTHIGYIIYKKIKLKKQMNKTDEVA